VYGQNLAVWLVRELTGAVRGTHTDGERIDLGLTHELDCLIWVGQQLVVSKRCSGCY